jgi:hypothetical protein
LNSLALLRFIIVGMHPIDRKRASFVTVIRSTFEASCFSSKNQPCEGLFIQIL